jgi:hypothetical protein
MERLLTLALLTMLASFVGYSQQQQQPRNARTTSAYSALTLRKVAVAAELKEILSENTSEYPGAKIRQFELDALDQEMNNMLELAESDLPKLTSGYGTLVLRKVRLESEIRALRLEYTSDYPDLIRKKNELNLLKEEIAKVME